MGCPNSKPEFNKGIHNSKNNFNNGLINSKGKSNNKLVNSNGVNNKKIEMKKFYCIKPCVIGSIKNLFEGRF